MTTSGEILKQLEGRICLPCMDISFEIGKSLQYTYFLLRDLIRSGEVIVLTREKRPETGHVANFYSVNPIHNNE